MPASSSWQFSFKRRDELDALIDKFDQDLSYRLEDLQAHFSAYADSILSMTSAHDDQYVSERIDAILKSRGLSGASAPPASRGAPDH
jgi:hypothetical protein